MVGRGRGHLFFIGSSAEPQRRTLVRAVHGASKAGVSLFCDALRCDLLGSGVRVTELPRAGCRPSCTRQRWACRAAGSELYDGYESIQPEDIAQLLLAALKMPRQVDVSRLEVFPTAQAVGGGRMIKTAG